MASNTAHPSYETSGDVHVSQGLHGNSKRIHTYKAERVLH